MAFVLGLFIVASVLLDAFGTIVLPRSVQRPIRFSTLLFKGGWTAYKAIAARPSGRMRNASLAAFAPATLLILVAAWVVLLSTGFGLMQWGTPLSRPQETGHLLSYLYLSGTTLLTLGYGDLTPIDGTGRVMAVGEATTGFIFLALIVGYIPVLYGPFARREQTMLRLDARAGSEPTGIEMILRHRECPELLVALLLDWEELSSALLEAYLSYPILAYYRSQHDDQSWLRSVTAVMDACALVGVSKDVSPALRFQAHATFAMARHLLVDLAYILDAEPEKGRALDDDVYLRMRARLPALPASSESLATVRVTYEPFVAALARDLALEAPAWALNRHAPDNWQTSAWDGAHF